MRAIARIFALLFVATCACACSVKVHAQDSNGQYWVHERERQQPRRIAVGVRELRPIGSVQHMIAASVSASIGSQWVATALRIAKIESGFRCNARNGRARGVFQVINSQQFGISASAVMTCSGGIAAGVAHMRACIAKGAATPRQLATCHNTGSPFGRRVERAYRNFGRG